MENLNKIQEFFSKSLEEMDFNDPVLVQMRANKIKADQSKPDFGKEYGDAVKKAYSGNNNDTKLRFLKKEREQLMRDMEQEAEPEGGPIANEYGAKLNRIDAAIIKLSGRKEMTYDQAIAEDQTYSSTFGGSSKKLMAKLHDKGELTVDGTKIVFKEGKKKSGYMGYTELAEEDKAMIQKIVKKYEFTIRGLKNDLDQAKKKMEEFEDARGSEGIANYRYYEKIIPKYEELIEFTKQTVNMIKGGADARHHVEGLGDYATKIFPRREYPNLGKLVPIWAEFAGFDKSKETRASDGRMRDLERERNREAGNLNEKEGVKHYTKDGKEWKGATHKMPNGKLMTQNPHNEDSEELFHKEDLSESLNPEVSKALNRFIVAMAKRYDYSEQDAVYAIMAALKQRDFDGLNEDTRKDLGMSSSVSKRRAKAIAKLEGRKEMTYDQAIAEAEVDYDFSERELIRVLRQLKRGASTEIDMIKAFTKALGRDITKDELFSEAITEEMEANEFLDTINDEFDIETLELMKGAIAKRILFLQKMVDTANPRAVVRGFMKELKETNPGLWANIRAKRSRGEKPSPKGSKAYKAAVKSGNKINREQS